MSKANINESGACGSGTGIHIYETPEYESHWRGACVVHGSFTAEKGSPDDERIEVVDLRLPGFEIRVRADDVRVSLRALLTASTAWRDAGCPEGEGPDSRSTSGFRRSAGGGAGRRGTQDHVRAPRGGRTRSLRGRGAARRGPDAQQVPRPAGDVAPAPGEPGFGEDGL